MLIRPVEVLPLRAIGIDDGDQEQETVPWCAFAQLGEEARFLTHPGE